MALSDTEVKLLTRIQSNLKHGDINAIAMKTGLTREHVSRVLSLNTGDFNKEIVTEAVNIISEREENAKKLLIKLSSVTEKDNNISTEIPQLQEQH